MWNEMQMEYRQTLLYGFTIQPYQSASDSYSGFHSRFYYMLPLKGIWCFLSLEIHLHLNDLK